MNLCRKYHRGCLSKKEPFVNSEIRTKLQVAERMNKIVSLWIRHTYPGLRFHVNLVVTRDDPQVTLPPHAYYINLFLVAHVIDGSCTPMVRTELYGGMRQSMVPYNALLTDHNYATDALMRDEVFSIVIEPSTPERNTNIIYSFNVTSCRIDSPFMRSFTPPNRVITRHNHMFATFCKPLHTKLMDYLHTSGALSCSARRFWMSPACAAAKRNHLYTKDESTVYPYGIGRLKNVNWQLFCHHHAKLFQSDVDIR